MSRFFVIGLGVLLALTSWAGQDGNGGDGVIVDGKPYLFDLFEHGLHLVPIYDDNMSVPEDIDRGISEALPFLSLEASTILKKKMSEIRQADRFFAQQLLIVLKSYFWSQVRDVRLLEIDDEDGTGIDYPLNQLVQLAARRGTSIQIDRQYFNQMTSANQAALILHEIIYALMPPKQTSPRIYSSASPSARALNAFAFSRRISPASKSTFQTIVDGINTELGYPDANEIHIGEARDFIFERGYGVVEFLSEFMPWSFPHTRGNRIVAKVFSSSEFQNSGIITEPRLNNLISISDREMTFRDSIRLTFRNDHYDWGDVTIDPTDDGEIQTLRTKVCGGKDLYKFYDRWLLVHVRGGLQTYDDFDHDLLRTYFRFSSDTEVVQKKFSFNEKDFKRRERQSQCYLEFDSMVSDWKKSGIED